MVEVMSVRTSDPVAFLLINWTGRQLAAPASAHAVVRMVNAASMWMEESYSNWGGVPGSMNKLCVGTTDNLHCTLPMCWD